MVTLTITIPNAAVPKIIAAVQNSFSNYAPDATGITMFLQDQLREVIKKYRATEALADPAEWGDLSES